MEIENNNQLALIKNNIFGVLRAYATILFLNHPISGLIILLATLLIPNLGLSGLIAAVTGIVIARFLNFPQIASGMHIYNSLLVGLSLGAFFKLDHYLLMLIILGAALAVLLTVALANILWRHSELPILSLPFVIVAMTMAFAARSYQSLEYFIPVNNLPVAIINSDIDTYFSATGAIYFMANPLVGLILFLIIIFHSRYLALLSISGYAIGSFLLTHLTGNIYPNLVAWSGFNFSLTAMAIGGIFTIPGVYSFVMAMIAAALAALVTTAMQNLLLGYGLPVMAFPFLLTTLTVLAALRQRLGLSEPYLAPLPALPEINYERARLAKVRNGEVGSIPLLAPFYGEWNIYQGFNGEHTHKPPWQYALDFYIVEYDKSYADEGENLEDYFCFGLPVLSPAYGTIIRAYDQFVDNAPGEMDVTNNWGNFILIQLDTGDHVLLAHLKQHSIKVKEKERVEPGMVIAACGNSGRSPQPHLHLQTQRSAELGSATIPFHLASIVIKTKENEPCYQVVCRPVKGDQIQPAANHDKLARNLHMPVGRKLCYSIESSEDKIKERQFHVEVTITGQYRLVSGSHASAAFEENNGVLAFYDRVGPKDKVLDAWLLANGLTPLTDQATTWSDAPSIHLFPFSLLQRIWINLKYPLGDGLDSQYKREWDEANNVWIQAGEHKITNTSWLVKTTAIISPEQGCTEFSLVDENQVIQARLTDIGLLSDQGIPGWDEAINKNE